MYNKYVFLSLTVVVTVSAFAITTMQIAHATAGVEMFAPRGKELAPGQQEGSPPGQAEGTPGLGGQNEGEVGQGVAKGNGQLK